MNKNNKAFYGDLTTRGYLPHYQGNNVIQFITFKLYDSLPNNESDLDLGYGQCFLKKPLVAQVVQDTLFFYNTKLYLLFAWVIMPNHVHILCQPLNASISNIVKKIKSYSSKTANKILQREGSFWQNDYFDTYIRNDRHLEIVKDYIESNPVKVGLCNHIQDWQFSSVYKR